MRVSCCVMQTAKADMKAAAEVMRLGEEGHELHEAPPYGHIPGVAVGDQFSGRGELAVLRLHTNMMRGICFRYAVLRLDTGMRRDVCFRYAVLRQRTDGSKDVCFRYARSAEARSYSDGSDVLKVSVAEHTAWHWALSWPLGTCQ